MKTSDLFFILSTKFQIQEAEPSKVRRTSIEPAAQCPCVILCGGYGCGRQSRRRGHRGRRGRCRNGWAMHKPHLDFVSIMYEVGGSQH